MQHSVAESADIVSKQDNLGDDSLPIDANPVNVNSDNSVQEHDDNVTVSVENIRVAFRSYKERPTTLKESILRFVKTGNLKYYTTFNALNGVSFQLKKGETLGIIGSNGAGKSTLLKVLTGVLPPVEGAVNIRGSLDSLIQLGAGFDPELNAIENIYLYASLRKKSRADIKSHIDEILEFAELVEFAHTPIKYYSSGMFARLGFAVAIDMDPDVLIVDEVLAVGDERFRGKCDRVFENFRKSGKTIVIVSHSMEMLEKLADKIALLSKGRLIFLGDPKEAIRKYRDKDYETALTPAS